jgi:high-affinity iron transporter
VGCTPFVFGAGPEKEQARTVVHMLDYVSVDYPEFVKGGQVLDTAEYAEQREFALQVRTLLEQLPKAEAAPDLVAHAIKLEQAVAAKAEGVEVSALAKALRGEVIAAYQVAVAPSKAPELSTGPQLYMAHCASCHGDQGFGNGPQSAGLEPAPRNFHDASAMAVRSPFGLYNTITLGVTGTSMLGWGGLSDQERWVLALYAAGLRAGEDQLQRGEALWKNGVGKDRFTNLNALVTATPEEVHTQLGNEGLDVLAWLTANPAAVMAAAPSPLAVTRTRLQEALEAYRNGQDAEARRLSISAYLEGFELMEAALDNVDAPLRKQTERQMMDLRAMIGAQLPADSVAAGIGRINASLVRAEALLSDGGLTGSTAFLSSLVILLREGLEAILVLAAIIAFVLKTGRRDALPYIHAGWIGAVVLGVGTWMLARFVINISGANREITEGITALLAAVMLLYVGYWLHNKSNARAWHRYVKDKVGAALGKRTLWALAGISFLAVYRELFEIILFYETLFSQAGPASNSAVLWGIVAAAGLLVIIGGAILKYSVRLPIGPFFAVTGVLLALMAVVFVGNGIAALQEAGLFDASFVRFITIPVLGIHPTSQGLIAQASVLAVVLLVILWGRLQLARAKVA